MRERRWLLLALYGLLLATAVSGALKATRPKFKIATTSTTTTTTEEPDVADNENGENEATTVSSDVNATTGHTLTGIPQIDYIWDPNLPRELNGFNLSEYPFYNSIPEEIDFKCDGLHDGFYASVPHKCQVYHHCLFGTRYDFLCANFTAFDQKTFICHFASEVDCANSKKYWHRNDALYKAAETTTTSTSTTSTTTTTTAAPPPPPGRRPGRLSGRRPIRRRPAYDYYEEDYYDDDVGYERTRPRGYDRRDDYDYEDRKYTRRDRERDRDFRDRDYRDRDLPRARDPDRPLREPERPLKDDREVPLSPRERFPSRNNRRDPPRAATAASRDPLDDEPRNRNRDLDPPIRSRDPEDSVDEKKSSDSRNRDVDDRRYSDKGFRDDYDDEPAAAGPASSAGTAEVLVKPAAPVSSVYARPRAPPKIRRPVPLAEQDKFSYKATSAPPVAGEARRRPVETLAEDDYYEDEIEEVRPRRPPARRRPGFRDFYETPRERDRDRPFRSRYRDDEEDPRPRKHPERLRGEDEDVRPRKHQERNRNDDEDARPRKHPERNRERYYERGPERGRDRSLDRSKDRSRHQDSERPERPLGSRTSDRDKDNDRPRSPAKSKEPAEIPESTRRPNIYDRTSVAPPTTSTTSTEPPKEVHSERSERPFRTGHRQESQTSPARNTPSSSKSEAPSPRQNPIDTAREAHEEPPEAERPQPPREENSKHQENPSNEPEKQLNDPEDYSSAEYYDELEDQPAPSPPPRTAVRVVKRPFLPSRGGNPSPRGLSPVGSKAPEAPKKEESQPSRSAAAQGHSDAYRNSDHQEDTRNPALNDEKQHTYDAYKVIQADVGQKSRAEEYEGVLSRPSVRRPVEDNEESSLSSKGDNSGASRIVGGSRGRNQEDTRAAARRPVEDDREETIPAKSDGNSGVLRPVSSGRVRTQDETSNDREKPVLKWNSEEYRQGQRGDVRHEPDNNAGGQGRGKPRVPVPNNSGYYSDAFVNENIDHELPNGPATNSATNKQIINEVVTHHRLQDIPESEYDVTLNEALTPSFSNQEGNLPSGFVLPIHRQLGRDAVLQSTENSYKVSRPYNQQNQQQQPQQQQQQKAFVPSPQFLPLTDIGGGNGNERSRSVQYFRTPEAVHVTGPQYRHQRGPWHDYTGY